MRVQTRRDGFSAASAHPHHLRAGDDIGARPFAALSRVWRSSEWGTNGCGADEFPSPPLSIFPRWGESSVRMRSTSQVEPANRDN